MDLQIIPWTISAKRAQRSKLEEQNTNIHLLFLEGKKKKSFLLILTELKSSIADKKNYGYHSSYEHTSYYRIRASDEPIKHFEQNMN